MVYKFHQAEATVTSLFEGRFLFESGTDFFKIFSVPFLPSARVVAKNATTHPSLDKEKQHL
ncbi:hypothetical protein [Fibrobacter sp. UWT2]|uniref:hypothetical protein n=1 Tax=Fibrobacter sp. UWT2 TaxID=1896224 RepID=UPI0015B5F801|nr:hypothetical protein [Fibrobacter sp. UWT2]